MYLDLTYASQRWLGLYERELYHWFKSLSRGIETGVDIGAEDGFYTLCFLAKTSAQRVLAFEPSTQSRERLRQNLQLNGLDHDARLEILAKFVGSRDDSETVKLDAVLQPPLKSCLIKVDVDGGEVDVLLGARGLLSSSNVHWIIETHSHELEQQCMQILSQAGYTATIVPNAWWRIILPELRPSLHNRWLVAIPK